MAFAIYTDSFSNLPGHLLESLNILTMPCTYMVEGEPKSYNGDIANFDSHAYYEMMRRGGIVTTTLVNTQQFMDYFRPSLEQGLDVLYVGMSSGVSGTYQAAVMAARELMEEFPGRKIRTVDSLGAGLGTGLLTCLGSDYRSQGKDVDEAADQLDQDRLRLCEYFTVDSLTYLRRTGRVSAATAAIGNVLNIKPLLYGDYEGHIVACEKYRGRKKVTEAIVERYRKKAVDPEHSRVFISHGDCPEEAQALAAQVRAIAQPGELIICPHEPLTGSHVGPGMLALFFMGDSR